MTSSDCLYALQQHPTCNNKQAILSPILMTLICNYYNVHKIGNRCLSFNGWVLEGKTIPSTFQKRVDKCAITYDSNMDFRLLSKDDIRTNASFVSKFTQMSLEAWIATDLQMNHILFGCSGYPCPFSLPHSIDNVEMEQAYTYTHRWTDGRLDDSQDARSITCYRA